MNDAEKVHRKLTIALCDGLVEGVSVTDVRAALLTVLDTWQVIEACLDGVPDDLVPELVARAKKTAMDELPRNKTIN